MLVIGLTGGIGSGKSTVAKLFAKKGIAIIDTDVIAREVIQPSQPAFKQLLKKFGKTILKNKSLNRAALRKIVFADPNKRKWLEKLLHPLIRHEMKKQIKLAQSPYCIAIIPLLYETKPNPIINRVLVVDAPVKVQLSRTKKRDKVSDESIAAIIKTQVARSHRLMHADDIIYNDGKIADLLPQVERLHKKYLKIINS